MPRIELPAGDYLHHARAVRPDKGGRTRVVLMRARLLAEYGGVPTRITTYDEAPVYDDVRARLREHGLLGDHVELTNIFEHYRRTDIDDRKTLSVKVPGVDDLTARDEPHPDGTVYRTLYTERGTDDPSLVDFRRADGSVFVRMRVRDGRPGQHLLLNRRGQPVGRWRSRSAWVRSWLEELVPPDRRAFVVADKAPFVLGLRGLPARFHLVDLMHSPHVVGERRWDSRIKPDRRELLAAIAELDGLVCLTDRQRDDVRNRFGPTDNLFVVPNPVVPVPRPEPEPVRDSARFVVLARLEPVKRLEHALRAVARARRSEPDVTLDIYGDGVARERLEQISERLGLSGAVTFHGFDQNAQDSLWTATGYLLTSKSEGYPLSTLEAMSHGCPVVSYDLKYGPRDQISDGVDGFLVDPGDVRGLTDAMLRLVRDPALTAKMSAAAVEKAEHHDPEAFVRDWKHVFERIVAQAPTRTNLRSCTLRVSRLGYVRRAGGALDRIRRPARAAGTDERRPIELRAHLDVRGTPAGRLGSAKVAVEAIRTDTGEIAPVPVSIRLRGNRFQVEGTFVTADLFGHDVSEVRLRAVLSWHNSAWQQDIARITITDGTEQLTDA